MTDPTLSPELSSESESDLTAEIVNPVQNSTQLGEASIGEAQEPAPSYVKLAMRNMVRKGGKSLFHFFLTTTGLIGLFIGLAYLTR